MTPEQEKIFDEILPKVADLLGAESCTRENWHWEIKFKFGASYAVSEHNGKFHVFISVPWELASYTPSHHWSERNGLTTCINIAMTKTPKQIADDINRRLMPSAVKYYQYTIDNKASCEKALALKNDAYKRVCAPFEVAPHVDGHGNSTDTTVIHEGDLCFKLKVSYEDHVEMEINCRAGIAEKVSAFLAALVKENKLQPTQ